MLGKLFHRATWQVPSTAARLGSAQVYSDGDDFYCSIKPLKVDERIDAEQQKAIGEFEFVCYRNDAIDETYRIKFENQFYSIVEIIHEFDFPFTLMTVTARRVK